MLPSGSFQIKQRARRSSSEALLTLLVTTSFESRNVCQLIRQVPERSAAKNDNQSISEAEHVATNISPYFF